jgi:L-alanine-DL-glutamate epimerase-like enolase superfamily enzyme
MRITAIIPLVVNAQMRNWVFVTAETDEGIRGWGEALLEWKTPGCGRLHRRPGGI